ncbi:MAG TPA: TIR domain-containing protein [Allosphingosinicella sp.]|jgi:predicted nucleotide-binding protein|nr:TIR domain-containing protein [Allosphingosinicella sp.]
MDRLLVADALGRTPSSSEFKALLSSSLRYGLTTGTEKADAITPTELGLQIVKPESEEQRSTGIVRAVLFPDLMKRIFEHFNRNKYPESSFLKNILEKSFGSHASHSSELAQRLGENGKFSGIIQTISGAPYVRLDAPATAKTLKPNDDEGAEAEGGSDNLEGVPGSGTLEAEAPAELLAQPAPEPPKQLFIAHGKNHKPLEDLKKVLGKFGIAFKVAVDEPHAGRPISAKVASLMKECSAGIFIFTKDELFYQKDGSGAYTEIWRPSENVVYELGAASILWQKNIILREEGVTFPSDFSDLGYITFQNSEIGSRGMELLSEFVALGLVKIQAV